MARDQQTHEQALRDSDVFYRRLWDSSPESDDLGAVMRGCMYCDEFLKMLILRSPNPPSERILGRQMFGSNIAAAMKVQAIQLDLAESLRQLSRIRGAFGHEFEKALTAPEVESLVKSLTGRAAELFSQIAGDSAEPRYRLRWALQALKLTLQELAFPGHVHLFATATLNIQASSSITYVNAAGDTIVVK